MKSRRIVGLVILLAAYVTPASAQVTNFSQDVQTAIDRALSYLDARGMFADPSPAGLDAGLVALALLEKRVDASQNAEITGYANARPADQARLDRVMNFILSRATFYVVYPLPPAPNYTLPTNFYAQRDGPDLMALSVYLRTGGPQQAEARDAINAIFDRIANNQGPHGYWCYSAGDCTLTETTQPVVAGLAYARGVFSDPSYADPVRLARLDQLTANARAAYAANGTSSGFPDEEGHGRYPGAQPNTIQDTAAGLWIQLVGGADLNDPDVQRYLRWLYHRYAYTKISTPASDGFGSVLFSQYLWSAAKALSVLADSGVRPLEGNLEPASLGTLPPLAEPAFPWRELGLDPAAVSRPVRFGDDGPGYYGDTRESSRWYFDFAYTVLSRQAASGRIEGVEGIAPHWGGDHVDQAFYILALQSFMGGGCVTGQDPACNQPPDAVDDSGSAYSGTAVTVAVLANDLDPNAADSLSVTAVTAPANGTVSIEAGTTVTYTPLHGFAGVDTFTYTLSDTQGASDTATVTINVTKRTATVTAGGGTKIFGASDPVLTTSSSGFTAEDEASITFTTTRSEGADVASYTTTASATGAAADNYDITFATGSFTITAAPSTTVVGSSPNPSTPGQAVTFTATVSSIAGTPTGTVSFFADAALLGVGHLDASGAATFTTTTLVSGAHAIKAVYDATLNFSASDHTLTQHVNMASTTTNLVSSSNPALVGTAVTFTATVAAVGAPGSGVPTGTVTFTNGVTVLGTGSLDPDGKATFTTESLAVGTHAITAAYGGSSGALGSASSILNQTVACPTQGGSPANSGCPVTSIDTVAQQILGNPSIKPATKKLLLATLNAAGKAADRGLRSAAVLMRVFIGEVQLLKRLQRIDAATADRMIADASQVLAGL